MKIIIDAMGGDNAPDAIVKGAVDAQREFGVDIVLVGREAEVKRCLADCGAEAGGAPRRRERRRGHRHARRPQHGCAAEEAEFHGRWRSTCSTRARATP